MNNFNAMIFLRKHRNAILLMTVGGFLISTLIGFGLYVGTGASSADTVLEVNGEKVAYQEFLSVYGRVLDQRLKQGEKVSPEERVQLKQDVLQSLMQEIVFKQTSEKYGVRVTDRELMASLASIPAFQKEGQFDPQTYVNALQYNLRATPQEFEKDQKTQIAISHLRSMVMASIKITNPELQTEAQYELARIEDPKEREKRMGEINSNIEAFREQVRQAKTAQIFSRWYQQIGSNLKISNRLNIIEQKIQGQKNS